MRKIDYFRAARNDIREIWKYVSKRNPTAAAKLVRLIDEAVEKLALSPNIGHKRDDVKNSSYWFYRVKSYMIAYRFTDEFLYFLRVVHGRRDFKRLFK